MIENVFKIYSWKGRLCRRQYLLAYLFVSFIVGGLLMLFLANNMPSSTLLAQIITFVLIPSQIKRLHDIGWSGFFVLLSFVPGINFIMILLLFILSGTKGPNKYGEDPRAKL